ncbi:hypothetical protein [Leucobacter denitrificans]|uniref:Uncharacterized protein n=1 Tax=Leucobacter denitrificans TaxID=683042 RepID=A0A7G9S4E2_9MICO|nr:hypothetical protein [Leucobacter denitrificans]QNN62717.1 hypothetical protein H9L06_10925 [Leucobacter denitrificans]
MWSLDPALAKLIADLGWQARLNSQNPAEMIIGDYARGFLILGREHDVQVARRSVRGGPSLKMWTPDVEAAQKYVAFFAARLLRFRQGLGDVAVPVDSATLESPFADASAHPLQTKLEWGSSWAEFGAGNGFAAVQFSHYGRGSVADTIAYVLDARSV